jgi:uncharacterized membrane protein
MTPPRRPFVDALRGLAVVLMVVNHTARWWLAPGVGAARDVLVYVTMALAGPAFLLLVGVSLALAYHHAVVASRPWSAVAAVTLRRAAVIAGAGLLVNAVVFPQDILGARVLVSIALALLVATPLLGLLPHPGGRLLLLAFALGLYAAFPSAQPMLAAWSRSHPLAAGLLLREFPLFPWLGLVLLGLVLGWGDAASGYSGTSAPDGGAPAPRRPEAPTSPRRRDRRHAALGAAGLAGLAAYALLDRAAPLAVRLHVDRDLVLNDYWTAGPVTAVGIVGGLLLLLALAYAIVERAGWPVAPLVLLGRAALPIYVLHLVLIVVVVRDAGGAALTDWGRYALATGLLLVMLVAVARVWLPVRGGVRRWRTLAAHSS